MVFNYFFDDANITTNFAGENGDSNELNLEADELSVPDTH